MRKEYYEIYRDLYDIYRLNQTDARYFERRFGIFRRSRPFGDLRTLRMIDDAITAAQGELGLGDRVRPDARLFLLVNLHQMVALPTTAIKGFTRERETQSSVESHIRQDVRDILEAAKEESQDAEVSGHAVVGALARIWEKLQINKLEVWG